MCARIECPPEETAELQAITMCLTFGVLQSRIFPETVTANNKLALVAQARLADSALLAQIKAGSLAIADSGSPLGAVRDLLDTIGRAAIYFRDRYRIKSVPLRAIIPAWVVEVLRGDLVKGEFAGRTPADFFGISEDEVKSFFSQRNINVTWALHLDGGSLDLGIVRDSSLVRVNDYMQFSETFETVVNIGCESMWITSTIDVTGKSQGPIAG
jgi:hypothetical protein